MNTSANNNETRTSIPSKEFDREYNTQWRKEMEFLKSRGIMYTFAKKVGEYKIPTYKYTKTPELFLNLAEFYNMQKHEKKTKVSTDDMPLVKGYIEIQPDAAEKKLCEEVQNILVEDDTI